MITGQLIEFHTISIVLLVLYDSLEKTSGEVYSVEHYCICTQCTPNCHVSCVGWYLVFGIWYFGIWYLVFWYLVFKLCQALPSSAKLCQALPSSAKLCQAWVKICRRALPTHRPRKPSLDIQTLTRQHESKMVLVFSSSRNYIIYLGKPDKLKSR